MMCAVVSHNAVVVSAVMEYGTVRLTTGWMVLHCSPQTAFQQVQLLLE